MPTDVWDDLPIERYEALFTIRENAFDDLEFLQMAEMLGLADLLNA
jgi:hypothetical protein